MPKTICVDFNGVLDQYHGWRGDELYPPADGAKEFLEELNARGFDVCILTSMTPSAVWHWLNDHGMNRLVKHVTNSKVPAVIYVDDRAVCHRGDFADTLAQIDRFKTHWEDSVAFLAGKSE